MDVQLGTITRADLRNAWTHEALDFTPWLEANIGLLGDVLGMDLEVTEREYRVGRFSLDLLAKDLGSGRVVAIENQLECTDHSHLGQLITYAAYADASVMVWIARDFCDEHRSALDWLNRGEGTTEFFGVRVELLQIDGSRPAAHFQIVASPDRWSRDKRRRSVEAFPADAVGSKSERYKVFFQTLIDELRDRYSFTNARTSQAQNWYTFSTGTTGISYAAVFTGRAQLRAELYIDAGNLQQNKRILDALRTAVQERHLPMGDELEWEEMDARRACRVGVYRSGTIANTTSELLSEYRQWFVAKLLLFKTELGPLIAEATQFGLSDTERHTA